MTLSETLQGLVPEAQALEAGGASCRSQLDAALAEIARLQAELEALKEPGFLPLATGIITTFTPDGTHGWVPNIYWKSIEARRGSYDFTTLDAALARGKVARVRIMGGAQSPDWLKILGAVTIYNATDGRSGTVPRWWETAARDAYRSLVEEMALRYDGAFAAVTMSAGMTIYAEPLMRELSDLRTRTNLLGAGFTAAADIEALKDGIAAHEAFRQTRTVMAFNPYQRLNPDGSYDLADLETCVALMGYFREALTSSIVQNNSIRNPVLGGDYPAMYQAMTAPKSFQTAGSARIGSVYETLRWAVGQGAHLVESFVGFDEHLSDAEEAELITDLAANG